MRTALGLRDRTTTEQVITRMVAIRTIIGLADDDEARDVVADELRVLGVPENEIFAAMLNSPN